MKEQAAAEKFRSIKAFKDFEQRSQFPEDRTLQDSGLGPAAEVSPLRVLAAVKARAAGVRRSELAAELQASPAAVETALLRLLKEGLVTVKAGSGTDELLITQ